MLSHEKLDVYRCSIEFVTLSTKLMGDLPKGNGVANDQLKRASFSIPLNIAEASGKRQMADRRRYFNIARGSAMECGAILDVLTHSEQVSIDAVLPLKNLVERIVSMLTKLGS
jgi:four helix bundle protein